MLSADVAESGGETVFRNGFSFRCLFPLFDCVAPFFEDVVVLAVESHELFDGFLRLFFVGVF